MWRPEDSLQCCSRGALTDLEFAKWASLQAPGIHLVLGTSAQH